MRVYATDWPQDIKEARKIQSHLLKKIRLIPYTKPPTLIAGVDATFVRGNTIGVVVLYDLKERTVIETAHAVTETNFPYIPGYLSFREGPAIVEAFRRLKRSPQVVIFDGQGIAHPRGVGLASHMGILLRMPSIGCAKSRLVGEYKEPSPERGARSPLYLNGVVCGEVVRTRKNVKPVFVSPGHLIDIEGSTEIVLQTAFRYRLPEPIREAHNIASAIRKRFV
ncbi:MAG: endonuclease V [Nitrospirae bacterium]|nr:MAG: endonuclease V [Nitrospirota bacterium]